MAEPTPHLLIVDDDERIRDLLARYLKKNGFLISAARDASHARRLLTGLEFDLIVLDIMMPGEDGVSLTKSLRWEMQTPILLLTARDETKDRIAGLEAGAEALRTKGAAAADQRDPAPDAGAGGGEGRAQGADHGAGAL